MRLAAVLHALDGLDSHECVSAAQVSKAIAVMKVLTEHARKMRDSAPNQTNTDKWAHGVLDWLRSHGGAEHAYTFANFKRAVGCKSNQVPALKLACEHLEALGWLRHATATRKDSIVWEVHPCVWGTR